MAQINVFRLGCADRRSPFFAFLLGAWMAYNLDAPGFGDIRSPEGNLTGRVP